MDNEYFKNGGMLIPHGAVDLGYKPGHNGVPIYAQCPAKGDLCACTGACRKILGYNTDPESVNAYHAQIDKENELIKQRFKNFTPPILINDDGVTKTWTWERKQ